MELRLRQTELEGGEGEWQRGGQVMNHHWRPIVVRGGKGQKVPHLDTMEASLGGPSAGLAFSIGLLGVDIKKGGNRGNGTRRSHHSCCGGSRCGAAGVCCLPAWLGCAFRFFFGSGPASFPGIRRIPRNFQIPA